MIETNYNITMMETNYNITMIDIYLYIWQDNPFFIGDLGDIIRKHKHWQNSFQTVVPFYGKYLKMIMFSVLYSFSIVFHSKKTPPCTKE